MTSKKKKVAVIGGGFTGLAAARRLANTGQYAVTVIERSPALGGLAGDFAMQGTSLEKTYHHIFRTDTDIQKLVEEMELTDHLDWRESSVGIYYNGVIYPFMSPGDVLRFKPCSFLNRIRLGLVALYLQKTTHWRKFVPQSAYEWMRRACGQQVLDVVWGPLLRGKFHRYYDVVSMAWLWARINIRGNSRKGTGTEMLGYFRGGFVVVTNGLALELNRAGATILTKTTVERLKATPSGLSLLLGGEWQEFDSCLFTGPSHALARLLADAPDLEAYRKKLQSIDYLGAITLVFATDQILGDTYWLNINELDAPFLVFIRHTRMVDSKHYNGKQVYYIGTYQTHDSPLFAMTEEELTKLWFDYLQKMFPHFDRSKVLEKSIFRLKDAQHVVDTSYEAKIPDYRTPLAGLYMANFSQLFPEDRGTNYSVREANKVTELILRDAQGQAAH